MSAPLSDDELRIALERAGWRIEVKLMATRSSGAWEGSVFGDTMSEIVAGCLDLSPFFVEDEEPR
jgi:hypothetical protein